MIEERGLGKKYGDFTAVRDLSFSVRPGQVLGLVGPNGAGKTTTLRCLAGIIPPTSGEVAIAGNDLASDPIAAKRALAFFPDEPRLFDYLTVRQHLAFVARIHGVTNHEAIAQPLLEEFEIADKADELPAALSLLPGMAVLATEIAVGVWLLGRRFEKLDLSQELRP